MGILLSLLASVAASVIAFIFREVIGGFFRPKSPGQVASDVERKMAQAVADTPDQAKAVKLLDDGNA